MNTEFSENATYRMRNALSKTTMKARAVSG
jgi:hypothetical protein